MDNFITWGLNILVESSICIFESQKLIALEDVVNESFFGNGVYALYYIGEFENYKKFTGKSRPIYVGKAVPSGWRSGQVKDTQSKNIYKRLKEHYKSIESVNNLDIKDFCCRYNIMNTDLISAVESKLIRKYKPLFNHIITGIGNHNVGSTRGTQLKPLFDEIHPGRQWASSMPGDPVRIIQCFEKLNNFNFKPESGTHWLAKFIANLSINF